MTREFRRCLRVVGVPYGADLAGWRPAVGTEVVRDADASGETKALACKLVDAKIITLESYDEYGYRYEYE
ncbi:hypothetical protein R1479_02092 [Ralstonia mannitolilytica]|nr:hypothetical protein R1479_02092 [Ralstonia mannitolilytica]